MSIHALSSVELRQRNLGFSSSSAEKEEAKEERGGGKQVSPIPILMICCVRGTCFVTVVRRPQGRVGALPRGQMAQVAAIVQAHPRAHHQTEGHARQDEGSQSRRYERGGSTAAVADFLQGGVVGVATCLVTRARALYWKIRKGGH